ncbi:P-loop ATPase, Sll1717 family [Acidisoma sp. 7E03]
MPVLEREQHAFDTFLILEAVEPDRFHNGDVFFVEGFRGTGKTSLLRWHANSKTKQGAITDFILFKTDLTEDQRMHLSSEVGISWTDVDPNKMEVSQDFKSAWGWFVVHKIGENLQAHPSLVSIDDETTSRKIIRLLGLNDDSVFRKILGFMPRLEGAHVKIKADVAFFEAELGGDFSRAGDQGKVSLDALVKRVMRVLSGLNMVQPLFIYFDELEAFYHSPEQHKRDQRLVRDLLFTIASMNDRFRQANIPIHIIGAVRSEVIDSMGSLGQEIDRLVHDRGFLISWHHSNRSVSHPLMEIVRRKLAFSETVAGLTQNDDILARYFPNSIDGKSIESFLLDKSFYKPRDIVWRLSLAQKLFPAETRFTQSVLHDTEMEYSSKLWDEVRYELSAIYSDDDINNIEAVLAGSSSAFSIDDMERRFDEGSKSSRLLTALLTRRSVREILTDLYRIGAIGNVFRTGATGSQIRHRWIFRGDPTLLVEKRMEIHSALLGPGPIKRIHRAELA